METIRPTLPAELSPILARSHLADAPLTWLSAGDLPAPQRGLLAHDHDMTSELAAFHGDLINLRILHSQQTGSSYLREVTLHAAGSGIAVEYGLIEILLDAFPEKIRPRILAGDTPLGAILNDSRLPYHSEPQGFFSIPAAYLLPVFPQSSGGEMLFGRYNHLIRNEGPVLARILEILP